jgi:integrase
LTAFSEVRSRASRRSAIAVILRATPLVFEPFLVLAAFFRVAADTHNRFEALFIVGALAGSRPQELLGLKLPDLVLPDAPDAPGEMRLVRRVSKSSEELKVVEGLKGSKRRKQKRRTVYLMPEAVAALKAHRRRYLEERMLRAERWEETWREP